MNDTIKELQTQVARLKTVLKQLRRETSIGRLNAIIDKALITERQPTYDDTASMLKADGFDTAIIGVGSRCGQEDILVYDREKCIEILTTQDMTYDEANEYFDFNVLQAWVGDGTPMFVSPYEEEDCG